MPQPMPRVELSPDSRVLKRTRNANATLKLLLSLNWSAQAWFCIGTQDQEISHSILIQARKDGELIEALWIGPELTEGLGFVGAIVAPPYSNLDYRSLLHHIKGTEPKLTPAAEAKLAEEWEAMRTALAAAMTIGEPIGVLRTGTGTARCKSKVRVGLAWLPCAGPATGDGTLCPGCESGLIF